MKANVGKGQIKNVNSLSDWHLMSETVLSQVVESWSWGSQMTDKQLVKTPSKLMQNINESRYSRMDQVKLKAVFHKLY